MITRDDVIEAGITDGLVADKAVKVAEMTMAENEKLLQNFPKDLREKGLAALDDEWLLDSILIIYRNPAPYIAGTHSVIRDFATAALKEQHKT